MGLNSYLRLAILALALAACTAPTAVPTQPAAATALPATEVAIEPATPTGVPPTATPQSTPAGAYDAAVPATSVRLSGPSDVAFDAAGNMFIAQCYDNAAGQILKVDAFGLLTVYASPVVGFSGDGGPARDARIACAAGLAVDGTGNLYVSDYFNHRIRRIDTNGIISTVAGSGPVDDYYSGSAPSGSFAGDGGPATAARLWHPSDVAVDAEGNLYIVDAGNYRIRRVDLQGTITTVAGTGVGGFAGDGGPATAAQLNTTPAGFGLGAIAFDADGNLYLADSGNGRIRKIDRQGIITTIAGTGAATASGDGVPATAASFASPTGLAFDASGNLYVADSPSAFLTNNRVYKIATSGIVTVVAGTGPRDFSGDGGPATSATLHGPWGITFDAGGNLYIADTGNSRIRRVDQNGIITTVVGGRP